MGQCAATAESRCKDSPGAEEWSTSNPSAALSCKKSGESAATTAAPDCPDSSQGSEDHILKTFSWVSPRDAWDSDFRDSLSAPLPSQRPKALMADWLRPRTPRQADTETVFSPSDIHSPRYDLDSEGGLPAEEEPLEELQAGDSEAQERELQAEEKLRAVRKDHGRFVSGQAFSSTPGELHISGAGQAYVSGAGLAGIAELQAPGEDLSGSLARFLSSTGAARRDPVPDTCKLLTSMGRWPSQRLQLIIENFHPISKFYDVDSKLLGKGSYGSVRSAKVIGTGAVRAVKTIAKEQLAKFHRLKTELTITKMVDHPNIIKLYEIFEDETRLYMVMELCSGGQLYKRLKRVGAFTEAQAGICMVQILRAIWYLHNVRICHRDMKPQNVLLGADDAIEATSLQVSDFGLSCCYAPDEVLTAHVGTTAYMAPQILKKSYNQACDLWSCGVIMFLLLCGRLPFVGRTKEETRKRIVTSKLSFSHPQWVQVSPDAIELSRALLRKNQAKRISADEAVLHTWCTQARPALRPAMLRGGRDVLLRLADRLGAFRSQNKFKKAVLHLIVSLLTEEQTKPQREAFLWLDRGQDGQLSASEIQQSLDAVVRERGASGSFELTGSDTVSTASIVSSASNAYKHLDQYTYTEFLAATFDMRHVTEDICWAVFGAFDQDADGCITSLELCDEKSMLGLLSQADCDLLVSQLDVNMDRRLDFEEFMSMVREPF